MPETIVSPTLSAGLARAFAAKPKTGGYAQLTATLVGMEIEAAQTVNGLTVSAYATRTWAGAAEAGVRGRFTWGQP